MGAVDQLFDRPVHHHPDERHRRQRSKQHRPHQEPRQGGLVLRDLGVHGGQRKIRVDHAQHQLASRVNVAGRVRAGGRVVDGANHRQQVSPLLVPEHARPVGAVELGERRRLRMAPVACLGALVHYRIDFARVGRKRDAAVLIEDPDALDARLAAQLSYDVVQRLAVVVQHFIPRAAQNHVGDAVGGLLHEFLRVNALRPQVDEAEQGEEGRRARRHRDSQLGGQSQSDCLAEAHLTATASASVSTAFRGASSWGCASKIGKYSATTRKIAKPAPTMDSVTATSVHLGM